MLNLMGGDYGASSGSSISLKAGSRSLDVLPIANVEAIKKEDKDPVSDKTGFLTTHLIMMLAY
jgi:hypothetical protein